MDRSLSSQRYGEICIGNGFTGRYSTFEMFISSHFVYLLCTDSEFYFDPGQDVDEKERQQYEAELAERMKNCQTRSTRLEKARRSPKAK